MVGPDGQEQVSITDLIVTDREFLVTGETWTNTATGSERFHDVLWRSVDGVAWDALLLGELVPGAKATSLVTTSAGLVVAGANYDSDTGEASPRVWLEQAGGDFVDLSSSIPGFDDTGWIEGAIADGEGLLLPPLQLSIRNPATSGQIQTGLHPGSPYRLACQAPRTYELHTDRSVFSPSTM